MATQEMTAFDERALQVDGARAAWREIDGDIVVVDIDTAEYLTMNGSGKLLWEALVTGATSEELTEQLAACYGISREQANRDVTVFLDSLLGRALVTYVG